MKAAVQSTVQETVQEEIKTYSHVVSKSVQDSAITTPKQLKKVVQDVVAQEDRSRNLVIFGLKENTSEQLDDRVSKVFEQIGEKPRFEAVRIGNQMSGKVRPVKVTVSSSSTVHQILVKSSQLRSDTEYKTVGIKSTQSRSQDMLVFWAARSRTL